MHSLLRGCAGSGAVGLFFSAWEGGKELSRPGSGPAGPKEARLGTAPHALVRLTMAVGISGAIGVCVEMVVLRRKTWFVFFFLFFFFSCFADTVR